MKVLAINGSPRKNWNTYTLLEEALEGAKSKAAEIELINLYDITYRGCISCFACKRKGVTLDQCATKDDLHPILKKVRESDAFILGSPIYFNCVTGEMRSFMERLFFPYISYDRKPSSFGKTINTAFIYTMNVPESYLDTHGYTQMFKSNARTLENIFGHSETLVVTETYQFDDYSKFDISMFDAEQRKTRKATIFREDCKKAYELGERIAES
jgi:multimeric flavodoxin WrbA